MKKLLTALAFTLVATAANATSLGMSCRSTETGRLYSVFFSNGVIYIGDRPYPVTVYSDDLAIGPTKFGSYGANFIKGWMIFVDRKGDKATDFCS